MRRIEDIAAAILAAAGAFVLVPGGQAAPLSKARPAPAVETTVQVRPSPSIRVVYPLPYAVPASSD